MGDDLCRKRILWQCWPQSTGTCSSAPSALPEATGNFAAADDPRGCRIAWHQTFVTDRQYQCGSTVTCLVTLLLADDANCKVGALLCDAGGDQGLRPAAIQSVLPNAIDRTTCYPNGGCEQPSAFGAGFRLQAVCRVASKDAGVGREL